MIYQISMLISISIGMVYFHFTYIFSSIIWFRLRIIVSKCPLQIGAYQFERICTQYDHLFRFFLNNFGIMSGFYSLRTKHFNCARKFQEKTFKSQINENHIHQIWKSLAMNVRNEAVARDRDKSHSFGFRFICGKTSRTIWQNSCVPSTRIPRPFS